MKQKVPTYVKLSFDDIIDINILSDQVEKLEDGLNATIIEHATNISRLEDKLDETKPILTF